MAIECHALDVAACEMLFNSVHRDRAGATQATYDELLTTKMLALAIALRTKFYQGIPYAGTEKYMENVGFMELESKSVTKGWRFTIKDVCDKIIHADEVTRLFDKPDQPLTVLSGTGPGNTKWTLGFSLSIFADAMLWWVEELDEA
ncbi:MAG: hypothetical protein IH627_06905 [Rubrivivax sp.]|nr:hypothetical protein [Rubrivivax sp.]